MIYWYGSNSQSHNATVRTTIAMDRQTNMLSGNDKLIRNTSNLAIIQLICSLCYITNLNGIDSHSFIVMVAIDDNSNDTIQTFQSIICAYTNYN